jgi:Calcineurin-like phosphoesterase
VFPVTTAYTYSNPYLSLWQSAAADVQRRRSATQERVAAVIGKPMAAAATTATAAAVPDLMAPVHAIGAPLKAGQTDAPAKMFAGPATAKPLELAAASVVLDCAKVAAEFLWAEITGNHHEADTLAAELNDSECDPLWAECLATYLAFKASLGTAPYRTGLNPVFSLDNTTKLAIIGDWGTGEKPAINVLQEVAKLQPDVLLHLGDVYYSGTQDEQQGNFLDVCQHVLGNNVRLFSMCGNHDMYSGGTGYYWLVDRLSQQASYFCLQNANWQFLAMDTGHNDNDPFTVGTNMTGLVTVGNWAEEDWHLDKINLAGNRKTVLLSHHQLFSPFGSVGSADGGKTYAYNKNLRATFQAVMSKIAWWFWGHEHTLAIYDPYMDLQRGRCVGASAVPVFTNQQSYAVAGGLETYGGLPYPTWNSKGVLAMNQDDYNHCFAIMTLTGASANVDYYQVPGLQAAVKLPVTDNM